MRHSVVYDDLVAKWAVVDRKSSNLVVHYHDREEAAQMAAEIEEANWPDLTGDQE